MLFCWSIIAHCTPHGSMRGRLCYIKCADISVTSSKFGIYGISTQNKVYQLGNCAGMCQSIGSWQIFNIDWIGSGFDPQIKNRFRIWIGQKNIYIYLLIKCYLKYLKCSYFKSFVDKILITIDLEEFLNCMMFISLLIL